MLPQFRVSSLNEPTQPCKRTLNQSKILLLETRLLNQYFKLQLKWTIFKQ